ncbi:WD40 repeat-like protein [Pseudovirgaria hyperparasitica]|uniref:WD40 repeat-like protein n=1 Tax=Pseudovirgaria hyperparasitica TaxID=470096 RepID=A0A6A6WCH2_9PEZI|nr:WD40 repeat-like protein [Pseudovirgaria hyperparasitica]KAF2759267.1 WD40 repeat-like protein [Pseudovirgaria hyperparasitica]
MAKRKREAVKEPPVKSIKKNGVLKAPIPSAAEHVDPNASSSSQETASIQIVLGSYERALHGFTASIPTTPKKNSSEPQANFLDTFLFNAHTSSVRCLAISPPFGSDDSKVILASGSTDERINLYQLSTSPPAPQDGPSLPSLSGISTAENPKNRELGSLLHHSSSITALYFPTKSKLLSASEDNTVAIAQRTQDWTVMSTIKAPIPKAVGRPSGDTLAPGEVPAGVNDFAVHPSMKLMITVGKGEKCMRLWNLLTTKKAGVLNFSRELLQQVGEGKHSSGEGRKIAWDTDGEEYTISFERGAVVYGLDSKPRAVIIPAPRTKIHQIHYVPGTTAPLLAVSTEDGRIVFYATQVSAPEDDTDKNTNNNTTNDDDDDDAKLPECRPVAELGGRAAGIAGRIKDFEIISHDTGSSAGEARSYSVIAGSSDGAVRIWSVGRKELDAKISGGGEVETAEANGEDPGDEEEAGEEGVGMGVGVLVGTYETGHRITCLKAFLMTGRSAEAGGQAVDVVDDDAPGDESSVSE